MTDTATLFLVFGLFFIFVIAFVQSAFDIKSMLYCFLYFAGGRICNYADAPLSVAIPLIVVALLLGNLTAVLYKRFRGRPKDSDG